MTQQTDGELEYHNCSNSLTVVGYYARRLVALYLTVTEPPPNVAASTI
jgi:hypothetical protein